MKKYQEGMGESFLVIPYLRWETVPRLDFGMT